MIDKIKVAKPDIIFSTLNGDSNVSFFKQMAAAGLPPDQAAGDVVQHRRAGSQVDRTVAAQGSYAAWNYFQSMPGAANKKFVAAYQAKYRQGRAGHDPMAHGYLDVYVWKAAVEKAKSFDIDKVRAAARGPCAFLRRWVT